MRNASVTPARAGGAEHYRQQANSGAQGRAFANVLRPLQQGNGAATGARQAVLGSVAQAEQGVYNLPEVANNGAGAASLLPHEWYQNSAGLYVTNANIQGQWQHYMTIMQNGGQNSLTPIQRLEGNAEVVFENSGLKNATASDQSRDRMDLERQFDAEAATLRSMGLDYAGEQPLTTDQYLALESNMQSSPVLETLAIQGHGLNDPTNKNFDGYTTDFQNNSGSATTYIGGGGDNGQNAVQDFIDDELIGHAVFPSLDENGTFDQLNQDGANEGTVTSELAGLNNMAFNQVLTSKDFSG